MRWSSVNSYRPIIRLPIPFTVYLYLLTYFLVVLQLYDTLHEAFERLCRVAIFLEEAALGERQAVNENVSFETELQLLERSHDAGL